MTKKILFALTIIFSLVLSENVSAQKKFWIKFKNKNGTPYSLGAASAFLSAKSIQRRIDQNIMLDNTDLPVTPSYVTQVDGVTNVMVLYRSKWLNGVVVSIGNSFTATALATINSFTFVQSTSPVNRYKISFPLAETEINPDNSSNKTAAFNYGMAAGQATMVGADCLHNMGFRGQGMTIAVLDAGFKDVHLDNIYDSLFMQNRLLGTRDIVTGDTMVFEDHTHGAQCLSTMAGLDPGNIIGTAPKAMYWLLRTEDVSSETISEEYNWIRGAEFADSVGADVLTTSLGYTEFDGGLNDHTYAQLDGKTAPMSIASTMAARKGMLVLNAAGNEGGGPWYYVGVPADADSIISVGSVGSTGSYSGFSSHGPTSDGRIKPDLVAQGGPAYVCYSGCGFGNGTSFATPVLAGAATCLWQSRKAATNMQIIQALKATADSASAPNNRIGWGIPDMCAAKSYSTLITVSVNEQSPIDHNIRIYPNPFSGEVNIWINDLPSENIHVAITNVLGQTLYDQTLTGPGGGVIHLNEVAEYKQGMYFVNLSGAGFNITKKILKQ